MGNVRLIDNSLERKDTTEKLIVDKKQLGDFFESHCKIRHYMFSVKKCGSADCKICKVPRLPADVFNDVHHLPDPIPDDDKYKSSEDAYRSDTSHCPSLSKPGVKKHGMPSPPSAQYAQNVKVVLQCGECSKWRVLYAKRGLKQHQKEELEKLIEDLEDTCGSVFEDIEAEEDSVLSLVFAKANLTLLFTNRNTVLWRRKRPDMLLLWD